LVIEEFAKVMSGLVMFPQYLAANTKKNLNFTMEVDKDLLKMDCVEQKVSLIKKQHFIFMI
jgi:hypothetical protein